MAIDAIDRLDAVWGRDGWTMKMKTIGAAKFKEQCLGLLDRLDPEGIVITKHGKPVATLKPFECSSASLIGALASKIEIHDDAFSTECDWDAVAEP